MINWNDLKYLLATFQAGSYSLAARELKVNRTTVARRITALERQLGTAVFEVDDDGYNLTDAGRRVIACSKNMAQQLDQLQQQLSLREEELSGTLRVAAPLGLGPEFMPELAAFSQQYPAIKLELINTLNPTASINQRQADVCILVAHDIPEFIRGRQIGNLPRALYASSQYLNKHPATLPLSQHQWVAWGREMSESRAAQWMQRHVDRDANIATQVNSWQAMREAVSFGLGVGHLWCFLAREIAGLEQISAVVDELDIGLWIGSHRDSNNRRAEAFVNTLTPLLKQRTQ